MKKELTILMVRENELTAFYNAFLSISDSFNIDIFKIERDAKEKKMWITVNYYKGSEMYWLGMYTKEFMMINITDKNLTN